MALTISKVSYTASLESCPNLGQFWNLVRAPSCQLQDYHHSRTHLALSKDGAEARAIRAARS